MAQRPAPFGVIIHWRNTRLFVVGKGTFPSGIVENKDATVSEGVDGLPGGTLVEVIGLGAGGIPFLVEPVEVVVFVRDQPPFAPLRSGPKAPSRPSRQKQIPSSEKDPPGPIVIQNPNNGEIEVFGELSL